MRLVRCSGYRSSSSPQISLLRGFQQLGLARTVAAPQISRRAMSMWRRIATQVGKTEVVMETGRMARNADGSSTVRIGNLIVLGTAVHKRTDAFYTGRKPLSVDFRERAIAMGKVTDTRTRRETAFTDSELRTANFAYRALAAALSTTAAVDTQVLLTLLSTDATIDEAATSINAASLALSLSQVDFEPVGAVRIAVIDGEVVANPSLHALPRATIDMLYAGTSKGCTLLHVRGDQTSTEAVLELVARAREHVADLVDAQVKLSCPISGEEQGYAGAVEGGKLGASHLTEMEIIQMGRQMRPPINVIPTSELMYSIRSVAGEKVRELLTNCHFLTPRNLGDELLRIERNTFSLLQGSSEIATREVLSRGFSELVSETLCDLIFKTGTRPDSRMPSSVRSLDGEVAVLPYVHGSSLVDLGHTQALCTVALIDNESSTVFAGLKGGFVQEDLIVSWECPPYASTNVARATFRYGAEEVDRSDILRSSLRAAVPTQVRYSIRLHVDVLSADGGSMSASIAAATLALMDAGIQVTHHVGCVTVGLVSKEKDTVEDTSVETLADDGCQASEEAESFGKQCNLLLDPSDVEEKHGAMVLHVAGTEDGITCCNLDTRSGRPVMFHVLTEAIEQGSQGLGGQLKELQTVLQGPRERPRLSFAVEYLDTDPEMRWSILGTGGANLHAIESETNTTIDLNEDGKCTITGRLQESVDIAKLKLARLIEELESRSTHDFEISISDIGRLIGRGGSNVLRLEKVTSCKIDLIDDFDQGEYAKVRVTGSSDEIVQEGVAAIRQNLEMEGEEDVNSEIEKLLLIPISERGRFIGRGGSNVSRLEKETSCKISVLYQDESYARVRVTGSSDHDVQECLSAIRQDLGKQSGGDDVETEEGASSGGEIKEFLEIPLSDRGKLIGRGGSNVSRLEKATSCRISILEDGRKPYAGVYVTGSPSNVRECVAAIRLDLGMSSETEKCAGNGREMEEFLEISQEDKMAILGRGGATIDRIRAESGANMRLKNLTLRIWGPEANVREASRLVNQVCSESIAKTINIHHKMKMKLIGTGGQNVAKLEALTQCLISTFGSEGKVTIVGPSEDAVDHAISRIQDIVRPLVQGTIHKVLVRKVAKNFAEVELLNADGSETGDFVTIDKTELRRGIQSAEDVVRVGQEIDVLCTQVMHDGALGIFSLRALEER